MQNPTSLEALLEITLFDPHSEQFASLQEYLEWFLKKSSRLIEKDDQLILANVHYISPRLRMQTAEGNLYCIPSIVDKTAIGTWKLSQYLAGTMAFLGAVRSLRNPPPSAVRQATESFKHKFLVEISRQKNGVFQETGFDFNPRTRHLTLTIPDLYTTDSPAKYFLDIVNENKQFIKEKLPNERLLVNGLQFENCAYNQRNNSNYEKIVKEITDFLASSKVKDCLKTLQTNFSTQLADLADFDKEFIDIFILTGLLHGWLKRVNHTYMIPISRTPANHKFPYVAIFLINTQNRLSIEKLNKLHIALNSALNHLIEIESLIADEHCKSQHSSKNLQFPSVQGKQKDKLPQNQSENGKRKKDSLVKHQFCGMIGKSEAMQQVFRKIQKVARHDDADVLILGDSGTGKEEVAKAIHNSSARNGKPFIAISLAERSDNLLESELFGHERGAFTGAHKQKRGYFELATGGTLFLDEIADISHHVQTKLLRVLQNREFYRVGGARAILVDVRILSATSENLVNETIREQLRFSDPLYYRLQEYIISVPPLRERGEDIPLIVRFYLNKFNGNTGKNLNINQDTLDALCEYPWPGNVRQLINVTKRAFINAYDDREIYIEHFELKSLKNSVEHTKIKEPKLISILQALRKTHFNIEHTVRLLAQENGGFYTRKTIIRHCRELCLIFLEQENWHLKAAVEMLAGTSHLEFAAAQKYKTYLFGLKTTAGILTHLNKNPDYLLTQSVVRKRYHPLLNKLFEKAQSGEISSEQWRSDLLNYSAA